MFPPRGSSRRPGRPLPSHVQHGTRLPGFASGPLRSSDGGPYQRANDRCVQIRRVRNADVADELALAAQQSIRIGQIRAEIEAEVDPIRMRGGEHERIAGPLREREMVGNGVHLVDELVRFRRLFEDHFSRGQRELLNDIPVGQQESQVLRVWWTYSHRAIVPRKPFTRGDVSPSPSPHRHGVLQGLGGKSPIEERVLEQQFRRRPRCPEAPGQREPHRQAADRFAAAGRKRKWKAIHKQARVFYGSRR